MAVMQTFANIGCARQQSVCRNGVTAYLSVGVMIAGKAPYKQDVLPVVFGLKWFSLLRPLPPRDRHNSDNEAGLLDIAEARPPLLIVTHTTRDYAYIREPSVCATAGRVQETHHSIPKRRGTCSRGHRSAANAPFHIVTESCMQRASLVAFW